MHLVQFEVAAKALLILVDEWHLARVHSVDAIGDLDLVNTRVGVQAYLSKWHVVFVQYYASPRAVWALS